GGSPREGARSELASGAATGGGGPQAPPNRTSSRAGSRRGKERVASLRAEQRLAAGGRRLPRPGSVTPPSTASRDYGGDLVFAAFDRDAGRLTTTWASLYGDALQVRCGADRSA